MQKERELYQLIPAWREQSRKQAIHEIGSLISETRRVPDYYQFVLTPSQELYSLNFDCIVKDIVERGSYIAEAEYEALLQTERMISKHNSGLVVWISPPYQGLRPSTKIIYSEIVKKGNVATIWNDAVIYDNLSNESVLSLARDIALLDKTNVIPQNLEDLRRQPIYVPVNGIHWTYILGEYLFADADWKMIREGEDVVAKELFLKEAEKFYDAVVWSGQPIQDDMDNTFGQSGWSCPITSRQTAFDTVFKMVKGEKWSGNCPLCGTYNKDMSPGDKCCGCEKVYKGCA